MMKRFFTYENVHGTGAFRLDMVVGWAYRGDVNAITILTIAGSHLLLRSEFDVMLRMADPDWWLLDLDATPSATAVVQ